MEFFLRFLFEGGTGRSVGLKEHAPSEPELHLSDLNKCDVIVPSALQGQSSLICDKRETNAAECV